MEGIYYCYAPIEVDDPDLAARDGAGRARLAARGLGLAGARAIVEQHGGMISVASVEGASSTFTVRLPLA